MGGRPGQRGRRLWAGLNLWAALVHYAYDGMIWRLRSPSGWSCRGASRPPHPSPVPRPGLALAVGLGLAVVPPGLYAGAVVAARAEQANDLLDRMRLARAAPVVAGVCELGGDRAVGGATPAVARKGLTARLTKLRPLADHPLPPAAPPAARVERAAVLIQLDRRARRPTSSARSPRPT